MEVRGFEPLTYGLQSHRSSQLSYTPRIFIGLSLHAATTVEHDAESRLFQEVLPAKLTSHV